MMDDPLFLIMQGIWLLAAGMYPLGFLFGACSACCDECPDECSKCRGFYFADANQGPCFETFDSLSIDTPIDSESVSNVTTNGSTVNVSVDLFSGTCDIDVPFFCVDLPNPPVIDVTFQIVRSFIEYDSIRNECECNQCTYSPRIIWRASGRYDPGRGGGGDPCAVELLDRPDCEEQFLNVVFDKCESGSATATVVIAKEQFINCLPDNLICDFPDEGIEVSVTLALDFNCECGACCRNSECTNNEPENYCENNEEWYGDLGNGTWQGVGTDCDPNPCEEE
jgi:hypothetical protein